jgi:hypothetical protein
MQALARSLVACLFYCIFSQLPLEDHHGLVMVHYAAVEFVRADPYAAFGI